MAKANLDVPIVPDSSTPSIEANAPKVSIKPPSIERVGEKLRALAAARLKGAVDAARVA
jgi:hypothetical protein